MTKRKSHGSTGRVARPADVERREARAVADEETKVQVPPRPGHAPSAPSDATTAGAPAHVHMVGIGASAGGLDAFLRLLRHVPADTGLAYLMVQHLDPTHESFLPDLIGGVAAIPVVHAADGMRVDANHAYVIPPNTTMTVSDGHLRLVPRSKQPGGNFRESRSDYLAHLRLNPDELDLLYAGFYPASIADQVSPERLRRFFVSEEGGYRITKTVRDACVFSRQNVVRGPPFGHLDLISCRNVLIYFEPSLQQRVFPIFHYALEPHGLLLVGSAESVGAASELFVPLTKRHKIYRRRATAVRPPAVDLDVGVWPALGTLVGTRRSPDTGASVSPAADEIQAEADRLVLARVGPPSVVVNDQLEILHFRGDTKAFLAHTPGVASLRLLSLAHPKLVEPLRVVIHRAARDGRAAREPSIRVRDGGTDRQVSVEALPFRPPSAADPFFVILFHEDGARQARGSIGEAVEVAEAQEAVIADGSLTTKRDKRTPKRRELEALKEDLVATRRYLQDMTEAHEATVEELRAANEEIQAGNEELQSTNEELQTTKEEVQSRNEELMTVNEELQHRRRELSTLASDLANVFASTQIPIVLVGRDLRLRRFTPASNRVMKVIPTDVGRPLSDVKLRVSLPEMDGDIVSAVDHLNVTEREVQDDDGRWWSLAIRPYLTIDRQVDGAVLVFSDIDVSKRSGEQAEAASEVTRELLVAAEEARATAEGAQHVAEEANKAKGSFLASMSHDLRTPLNAIIGYTDLLQLALRGPVTDAQASDFARIKRSAQHLLALINDILNFAKLEAGNVDLRMSDVAVAPVIDEVEDLLQPQMKVNSLRLEHVDHDAIAYTDPEKFRQILINLLSNAIKYTAPGGRVGVDVVASETETRIAVWDTGVGISADQHERIFEPFVQVGRGLTTSGADGVGLGLAISRELARAMRGDLTVESTPGVGSRFVLTLPHVASPNEAHVKSLI